MMTGIEGGHWLPRTKIVRKLCVGCGWNYWEIQRLLQQRGCFI